MKFNIFMDDIRNAQDLYFPGNWREWVVVRHVDYVKEFLKLNMVNNMSLDHDMGEEELTGYDLLCWCQENNIWPYGKIHVHSANPVGKQRMLQIITKWNK